MKMLRSLRQRRLVFQIKDVVHSRSFATRRSSCIRLLASGNSRCHSSWYNSDRREGVEEIRNVEEPPKDLGKLTKQQRSLLDSLTRSPVKIKDDVNRNVKENGEIFHRSRTFKSLQLRASLVELIEDQGFKKPTQIQIIGIPPICTKKCNVVLHAETGSGKTLAFLLPIIQSVGQRKAKTVIVAPTRELASQIYRQATSLSPKIDAVKLMTDISLIDAQSLDGSTTSPAILIGIPRVIVEAIRHCEDWFKGVSRIVLDEIDKLLPPINPREYGARRLLRQKERHPKPTEVLLAMLLKITEGKSQMIASSATVNRFMIDDLCHLGFGDKPLILRTRQLSAEKELHVPMSINHRYIITNGGTDEESKARITASVMEEQQHKAVLVFVHRNDSVQRFVDAMIELGISCVALHQEAISDDPGIIDAFKEKVHQGHIQVVVGNEETVRGLDFPRLSAIYMTDVPRNSEEYVHLAGRVGRQGQPGSSVVLVDGSTEQSFKRLQSQYARLQIKGKQLRLAT